jgi:hypothetical protein
MKLSILLSFLLLTSLSFALEYPQSCTKEEKQLIKSIVKEEQESLKQIIKVDSTIIVEFMTKRYIIENNDISSIETFDGKEFSNSEYRLPVYYYNFDEGKDEQRIEIQPINDLPSYTLYYNDSYHDNKLNATVYYTEDATVTIGDNFIIFEDNYDTTWFSYDEDCSFF